MSISQFTLVGVIVVVLANVLAESRLWRQSILPLLRRVTRSQDEEMKDPTCVTSPWFCRNQVETGILEVALAVTATTMALPALVQVDSSAAEALVRLFELDLLVAAVFASACSLWLLRIYVRQLMSGRIGLDNPSGADEAGSVFSVSKAGPYALLAYGMGLLLIGLALLPFVVAL